MQKDFMIYTKHFDYIKANNKLAFYKDKYFHSIIDFNLIKLDLILRYGILSKEMMRNRGISVPFTHDSSNHDSKNGDQYISVTKYNGEDSQSTFFNSFALHTLTSISLIIDDSLSVYKKGERETYFNDEFFVLNQIPRNHVLGIFIPSHLHDKKIREVTSTGNDINSFSGYRIERWIKCTESYFNTIINKDEINTSLKQLWSVFERYEEPARWLEAALRTQQHEFGRDLRDVLSEVLQQCWNKKIGYDVNMLDVVNYLNNDLPVYDESGVQLVKKAKRCNRSTYCASIENVHIIAK